MRSSSPLPDSLEPSVEELYEDAPCGYATLAADGTVLRANRTLLRALGLDAGAVVGQVFEELLAPGSRIYHATYWGPLLELQDEVREIPVDLVRGDGSRLTVLFSAFVSRDESGAVQTVRASLFDASDRRRYERELVAARDGERAIRLLGQRAVEGLDSEALRADATELLRQRLGSDDVVISAAAEWEMPREVPAGERLIHVPLGRPGARVGSIIARRATPFDDAERGFAHALALVVGGAIARERAAAQVFQRAREDVLTGLPNEFALQEAMEAIFPSLSPESGFPICLLDLAGFRLLNDSRGHQVGNTLLRSVGARLCAQAPAGSLVGRVGGDEFLVVAPVGFDEDRLAEVLSEALDEPFAIDGMAYRAQANMGTLSVGLDADPTECVVMNARIAMHLAQDAGQLSLTYVPEMRERSQRRMQIEAELAVALREDQLRVFYQPVVSLEDGRTVSMEALVRWEHPDHGLVPPGAFIPVAEQTDLICDLGEFVLREATRQLAQWRDEGVIGPDVSVAVNVSPRQFARPGFPAAVVSALEDAGLAGRPALLGLEITETMLMNSGSDAEQALTSLSETGVGLLLDDFGTGLSSLARLKRLPVDTLKIDRAFISELGRGDEDEAIVAAILAMAGKLGLRIVAEGAETQAQLELLRELGCERVQGFVYSRPLPAADFAAYAASSL